MGTGRIEAFSDGVFAIAITLLVLEFGVPPGSGARLTHALLDQWPSYLSYVTSFLTIGVIWVNHHSIFEKVARADRGLLLVNTVFLMVVAFIPFPTRLIADYLNADGERSAAVLYGLTLTALAILFQVLWISVSAGRRLIREDVPQDALDDITRSYRPGVFVYGGATALAFASPIASVAIYLLVAAFFSLPPSILRRT